MWRLPAARSERTYHHLRERSRKVLSDSRRPRNDACSTMNRGAGEDRRSHCRRHTHGAWNALPRPGAQGDRSAHGGVPPMCGADRVHRETRPHLRHRRGRRGQGRIRGTGHHGTRDGEPLPRRSARKAPVPRIPGRRSLGGDRDVHRAVGGEIPRRHTAAQKKEGSITLPSHVPWGE